MQKLEFQSRNAEIENYRMPALQIIPHSKLRIPNSIIYLCHHKEIKGGYRHES